MSVTFFASVGEGASCTTLGLDISHPSFVNYNNGNAARVLAMLKYVDPWSGNGTTPDVALYYGRVPVEEFSERLAAAAAKFGDVEPRLAQLQAFVECVRRMGADRICWE